MLACAELLTELLKSREFNFNVKEYEDGDVLVDFPFQGKVFRCIFSGNEGTYLSLYCQFESIPDEKVADLIFICNELNAQYKWATFYVDSSKDLMIHDDAILSLENAAEEAFELLIRMVKIGEEAKPIIMKGIYA